MRKDRRNVNSQQGASLLELVCALFVVTVGVFGVIQSYNVAITKTKAVDEYAIALRALSNELETLRALSYDALPEGRGMPFRSETPEAARLVNATPEVTIVDGAEGTPGLKLIRVRLRWTGEHGRTIDKQLTTLVARRD